MELGFWGLELGKAGSGKIWGELVGGLGLGLGRVGVGKVSLVNFTLLHWISKILIKLSIYNVYNESNSLKKKERHFN